MYLKLNHSDHNSIKYLNSKIMMKNNNDGFYKVRNSTLLRKVLLIITTIYRNHFYKTFF